MKAMADNLDKIAMMIVDSVNKDLLTCHMHDSLKQVTDRKLLGVQTLKRRYSISTDHLSAFTEDC